MQSNHFFDKSAVGFKTCRLCLQVFTLDDFFKTPKGTWGVSAYCKSCFKEKYQNKDKNTIAVKRYRDKNREAYLLQHREHQYRRRMQAGKRLAPGSIKDVICDEQCFYCNAYVEYSKRTIDHLTPLSRGGTHTVDNLVMSCGSCNSSKHNLTYEEYMEKIL